MLRLDDRSNLFYDVHMLLLIILLIFAPALFRALRQPAYYIYAVGVLAIGWWNFKGQLGFEFWEMADIYFMGVAHLIWINIITFFAYGWDKRQAKYGGWRIPEKTLHALAFMGGTIGALKGIKFFRHKTMKKQFRQMFTAVLLIQFLIIGGFFWVYNLSV